MGVSKAVKGWCASVDLDLVTSGYIHPLLNESIFEWMDHRERSTLEFYDDRVVKRRLCRSASHAVCGTRCVEHRARDLAYMRELGGEFTPPLIGAYAEHDEDGIVDIVSIQYRAEPASTLIESGNTDAFVNGLVELVIKLGNRGVVHGDIRMENIVLFEGKVQLIDWECAVTIGVSEQLSDIGAPRGPEYAPDEWRDVDAFAVASLVEAVTHKTVKSKSFDTLNDLLCF